MLGPYRSANRTKVLYALLILGFLPIRKGIIHEVNQDLAFGKHKHVYRDNRRW
jgi:hypothetical protein